MTTAASVTTRLHPWVGRALSDEALILSKEISAASKFQGSIAVGEPRGTAQEALDMVFEQAQVQDWDSAGSAKVEPSTYIYATEFLQLLPTDVPSPEIAADTDGEILFAWDLGPRRILTVSVSRDGTLSFAALFGHKKNYGTEPLREVLPLVVSDSLVRFVTSTNRDG